MFPPVRNGPASSASYERARAEVSARLRERRSEIESAVLTRVFALSDDGEPLELSSLDPEYLQGLRAAASAAVQFALEVIERGEDQAPPPPPLLLAQARLAARHGVALHTILRRYSAGFLVFSDFLVAEAGASGMRGAFLQRLLRAQAVLDRVLAAVSEEYAREQAQQPSSSKERLAERVERLLAGELLDTSSLGYELACTHLAAIATGQGVQEALRSLARAFQCRLLVVERPEGALWAWLGSREPLEMCELHRYAGESWPGGAKVAIGEPGAGLEGWRLSHRQARAALAVAQRSPEPFVRYADVALLAAVLSDELLASTLRRLYLRPLEAERDGGEVLRETLRAYFEAGRNVSAAAGVLGIKRHTVTGRLRAAEEWIGCPLESWGAELEVTLRLSQLQPAPGRGQAGPHAPVQGPSWPTERLLQGRD